MFNKPDEFKSDRKALRLNLLIDQNVIDICCRLGRPTLNIFFDQVTHVAQRSLTLIQGTQVCVNEDRLDE